MRPFDKALARMAGRRVYIDTNILIYFFNRDEKFFDFAARFLSQCAERRIFGVVSELVVAEIMVQPYRERNPEIIARFRAFFAQKDFLHVSEHRRGFIGESALIAGERGMKLIDAMHFQAAIAEQCDFFITHDDNFKSTESMEVIQLRDYM